MPTVQIDGVKPEVNPTERITEAQYEKWVHWPVCWSAIWVGALAAVAAVLVFGLIGIALGAHLVGPEHRVVDLKKIALGTLAFSVFSAFLSFVIGGWIAGKIAGILRSEPAMLHGAIVWLVAIPLLVLLAGFGAGSSFGGWYAGLAGTPSWATPAGPSSERSELPGPSATEEERKQLKEDQAAYNQKVARNSALGVITALLLGLVGSVIGGWMASGEPMTFTYHRTRQPMR
jgi:hypothetical protein